MGLPLLIPSIMGYTWLHSQWQYLWCTIMYGSAHGFWNMTNHLRVGHTSLSWPMITSENAKTGWIDEISLLHKFSGEHPNQIWLRHVETMIQWWGQSGIWWFPIAFNFRHCRNDGESPHFGTIFVETFQTFSSRPPAEESATTCSTQWGKTNLASHQSTAQATRHPWGTKGESTTGGRGEGSEDPTNTLEHSEQSGPSRAEGVRARAALWRISAAVNGRPSRSFPPPSFVEATAAHQDGEEFRLHCWMGPGTWGLGWAHRQHFHSSACPRLSRLLSKGTQAASLA